MEKGFQLCPKCVGSGKKNNPVFTGNVMLDLACNLPIIYKDKDGNLKSTSDIVCPVCNGKMIISMETGLPPQPCAQSIL